MSHKYVLFVTLSVWGGDNFLSKLGDVINKCSSNRKKPSSNLVWLWFVELKWSHFLDSVIERFCLAKSFFIVTATSTNGRSNRHLGIKKWNLWKLHLGILLKWYVFSSIGILVQNKGTSGFTYNTLLIPKQDLSWFILVTNWIKTMRGMCSESAQWRLRLFTVFD